MIKIILSLIIVAVVLWKFKSVRALPFKWMLLVIAATFCLSYLAIIITVMVLGWLVAIAIIFLLMIAVVKAHGALTRKTKQFIRSERPERRSE